MTLPSGDDALRTRWSMLDQLDGSRAEESWHWFIQRYRGFVAGVLHRMLRDPDEARRAVDEFWGHLFTSRVFSRADRNQRFRSFLAGTVRNFARERIRARARDGTGLDPDLEAEAPAFLPEDEELSIWAHTVLDLCLDELRRAYSTSATVLCLFYGLPVSRGEAPLRLPSSQIAAQLGLRHENVHQHLHRARQRLRRLVEDELRETVRRDEELEDELGLLVTAIVDASPGLIDR